MPLTENQAKNAKPLERAYKLADSEGLFLLVQPNGAKLWRMKYRFAGNVWPAPLASRILRSSDQSASTYTVSWACPWPGWISARLEPQ
jgi:hypothetical protein